MAALTLTLSLTACPLPIDEPMDDEAGEDTDTTDDTDTTGGKIDDPIATESSESDTGDFSEPTDSGVAEDETTDESTDSTDESTDESTDSTDESTDDGEDMEKLGCCVCPAGTPGPICLPPESATGVACGELSEWAGVPAIWVPCVTDLEGLVVCEMDCGS